MLSQVYVGAPFSVFFAQVGSCWRSWALCWLILSLLSPILSPSCSKMAPSWPNIAQHGAKMGQNGLQEHPQAPQQKLVKTYSFFVFFAIWLFAPKIPKSGQDASQNGLKLIILKSKMAILAPSWRQVGHILAPSCPQLAPSLRQDAPQQTSK